MIKDFKNKIELWVGLNITVDWIQPVGLYMFDILILWVY